MPQPRLRPAPRMPHFCILAYNKKKRKTQKFFMNKYIAYCRKSTDEADKQVLSIEAQIAEVKEFAARENIKIIEVITESRTAKQPGRMEFGRMLKMIEKGEADGIVSWHPDRLARNSVDGGQIIYLLDTGKLLDLKFPSFWFENTPQGKFMLNIAFGQSKYYVDNLGENVKRGNRQKIRRGEYPNKAPYGYLNDFKTKTIKVDIKIAKIIIEAFKLFASGRFGFKDIQRFLIKNKVLTPNKKPIHLDAIRRILTNTFYYGTFKYGGEFYQGKHKPIISKKLFDECQRVIKQKTKYNGEHEGEFNFLGLIKCGECGASITAERRIKNYPSTRGKVDYVYYRCTKKLGNCSQKYLPDIKVDNQLREAVYRVSLSPFAAKKFLGWGRKDAQIDKENFNQEIKELTSAILEVDIKLERLLDGYLDKTIERADYQKKKNELIEKKVELQEKNKEIEEKGCGWLGPFEEFVNCAYNAQKIAHTKNNGHDLSIMAKTVGSDFFLLDKIITLKYKNEAFLALAAGGVAACASPEFPQIPSLLEEWNDFRTNLSIN